MHAWMPALLLALLALAGVGLFALARFFTRRVPMQRLSAPLPPRAANGRPGRETTGTELDTFIVIPDISGYTRFMRMTRFAAAHAQLVVSQLLQAMLDAAVPPMSATRVEGDSVVFSAPSDQADPDGVAAGTLARVVHDVVDSFYRRRGELVASNLCPCEACRHIATLDLKVVVHRGAVLRYRLQGLDDLSGIAVIEAHRLLKNSVPSHRYVLVSEAAGAVRLRWPPTESAHREVYDDVGEIRCALYLLEPPGTTVEEAATASSRAGDLALKLASNVQSLKP